jgi:hypothetical protein
MVLNCTVFPLCVWRDIIFDVFASAVIGASNAAAVSKEPEESHFLPPSGELLQVRGLNDHLQSTKRHGFQLGSSRDGETEVILAQCVASF